MCVGRVGVFGDRPPKQVCTVRRAGCPRPLEPRGGHVTCSPASRANRTTARTSATSAASTTAATGWSTARFHAVRAPIHLRVLPEELSRDFAAALLAREHGLRTVSVESAVCTVPRVPSLRKEFRRKVRTIVRGWHTLHFKRALLNPFRHGLFSWILASHKICRWIIPHVTLPALVALLCLARTFWWARWGAGCAAAAGLCAALAWWWPDERRLPKVVALPAYFVLGNVAALYASLRAVGGERTPLWEPTRREVGRAA